MRTPLFLVSIESLKARLRLSGMSEDKDIADLLDEAISAARFRFYRDLGLDCVTALLALTREQNPTTEDGLIRDLAELTEARLVRKELMGIAPLLFVDKSGNALSVWNEEGFTRGADPTDLGQVREVLESSIRDAMDILKEKALPDPITPGQASVTVWTTEPATEAGCASCY